MTTQPEVRHETARIWHGAYRNYWQCTCGIILSSGRRYDIGGLIRRGQKHCGI